MRPWKDFWLGGGEEGLTVYKRLLNAQGAKGERKAEEWGSGVREFGRVLKQKVPPLKGMPKGGNKDPQRDGRRKRASERGQKKTDGGKNRTI